MITCNYRRARAVAGAYGQQTHRPAPDTDVGRPLAPQPRDLHRRRRPERTALYRLVQQHLET